MKLTVVAGKVPVPNTGVPKFIPVLKSAAGGVKLSACCVSGKTYGTLWRWLLMPSHAVVALAWLLLVPGDAAERAVGLSKPISALDAIAIRAVARAILGDVRAARTIFDLIEGKPRRRREIGPSAGVDPVEIEKVVKLFYERAAPTSAGAGR